MKAPKLSKIPIKNYSNNHQKSNLVLNGHPTKYLNLSLPTQANSSSLINTVESSSLPLNETAYAKLKDMDKVEAVLSAKTIRVPTNSSLYLTNLTNQLNIELRKRHKTLS